MNINISLIGQMLTFMVLVVVTMKYIWPPVMEAMEERRRKIAKGLADAEQGEKKLLEARKEAKGILDAAKQEAKALVDAAEKRCHQMIEAAKDDAKSESSRLIQGAHAEIDRLYREAKLALKDDLANQVMTATEKVLSKQFQGSLRQEVLESILEEV